MTDAAARLLRRLAASMACVAIAGCAGLGMSHPSARVPGWMGTPTDASLAPQAAMEMIAVGRSSKIEVRSALGQAIVIAFDSGYEVWVYRWAGADGTTRAATELVVLFEPSGLATKLRLRPGYAAHD